MQDFDSHAGTTNRTTPPPLRDAAAVQDLLIDRFPPEARSQIEELVAENNGLLKSQRVKDKALANYKRCLDEAAAEIARTANVLDVLQDVICWAPVGQFTPDELRAVLKFLSLILKGKHDDLAILFFEHYRYNPASRNGGVRD